MLRPSTREIDVRGKEKVNKIKDIFYSQAVTRGSNPVKCDSEILSELLRVKNFSKTDSKFFRF